jgi:Spy/CpxP family protein refolding chaperone
MRSRLIFATAAALGICTVGFEIVSTGADKKPTPAAKPGDDAKPRGRLPANFGKLDLTSEQRTRIYEIQGQYDQQIDALVAQLEEARDRRDTEVEAVLTADQKDQLTKLRAESRQKKADRKSKTATKAG